MGLTCKPVGKLRGITRKMENELEKERLRQKELIEAKKNRKGKNN